MAHRSSPTTDTSSIPVSEPIAEGAASWPAPGELELVRRFVNTIDLEEGIDELGSPELLRAWLADRGLATGDERLTDDDLRTTIELRETLRAFLFANNGEPLDPKTVDRLNASVEDVRLLVRFDQSGAPALSPERDGLEGALGSILAIAYRSMAEGTWTRLKACRADTCQWAFYDKSRNRSAHWCSMAVCGNRAKARTYRRRHKPAAKRFS
jgi:predicted RNA-binding Zn ribbon-like protein